VNSRMRSKKVIVMALASAIVSGCVVGPDFVQPTPPKTTAYTAHPLPQQTASTPGTAGVAQRLVTGQEISGQWWTLFHSKPLDSLVRAALENSPTLAAAQATLREAQEQLSAEFGVAVSPAFDARLSAQRQRVSGASFGQPNSAPNEFNLYNASVDVTYSLSLAGGAQRELESLRAQIDYQQFQLEATYLALTTNIVTTAVREASLRAQIRATQDIVAAQEKQLSIVERQFQLGAASRPDVLVQRTQLARTRASLPALDKALAQTRHALAMLAGRLPGEPGLPEFELTDFELPQSLPVSLPSALVRQRPDIRASEALLHQASAQVGVATAALFPEFTLSAALGTVSTRSQDLFQSGTGVWNFGLALLQPLFHGGELTARRRGAIAAYDQAAAQYQQTVLLAFENVADVLRALDTDAVGLKANAEAESAARDTLAMSESQFKLGAVSYLVLLVAQLQYQQAQIALVQAQATRFADTAALFQALGGGWWNRAEPLAELTNSHKN
jgi:NodT family efflux transporter outer membrane factor (OMF) lipoprotein